MRLRDKTVNSISEILRFLKGDIGKYKGPIWFRGHANKKWGLIPGYYRNAKSPSEMTFLKRFKQSASLLLPHLPGQSFDWLFLMQHHGVPTRLLDWTESPLTACYFACSEEPYSAGAIWILMPVELNKNANIKSDEKFYIPSFEEGILENYSPETFASEKTSSLLPVAALATRNSPRMQSQLGVFTISHKDQTTIEEIGDCSHVWRFIIPAKSKKQILRELQLLGIGEFQLFPELQSIGKIIKNSL